MFTTKPLRFLLANLMSVLVLTYSAGAAQPTQQDSKSEIIVSDSKNPQLSTQEADSPSAQGPVSANSKDWNLFEPKDSRASFKMPVKPTLKQRMFTPVEGQPPIKIHNFLGVFNDDKGLLLFNYHDLYQAPADAAIEETLKEAMLESISSVRGRLVSEQKIRYRTNPGRTFEFRFARNEVFYKGTARIFLVGNRQYQVAVMMEEDKFDKQVADSFLNSLRLSEPEVKAKADSETKMDDTVSTDGKANSAEDSAIKSEDDSDIKIENVTEEDADSSSELKLPLNDDGKLH